MVLDGLKGFQSKKSKFLTFNYKSADRYLVLPSQQAQRGQGEHIETVCICMKALHESHDKTELLKMYTESIYIFF